MQHNASVIRQFSSLKNTYGVLKVSTHHLVLNMHLDVNAKNNIKTILFHLPHIYGVGITFSILLRGDWLCGAETGRGRAGIQAWKGRLQGSPLYLKAFAIINDYQVES